MCKEKGQCHGHCGNCRTPLPRQLQKLQEAFANRKEMQAVKHLPEIELSSLQDDLMQGLVQKAVQAWEKHLIAALIPKLVMLGVDAREDNMPEWASRLTKVEVQPEVFEYYLDYNPEDTVRITLVTACEKQTITYEDGKATVTIG